MNDRFLTRRARPGASAWLRVLLAACAAWLLLAGCAAPSMPSQVTVFSEWLDGNAPRSYRFVRTPEQDKSLEHKAYEQAVREALSARGFTEAGADARYTVAISYSIAEDKRLRELYVEEPWLGLSRYGWGWSSSRWSVGGAVAVERPWYTRMLRIDISDAQTGAKRYEVTARNDTLSNALAPAVPLLARAALADFPQGNGTVKIVRVPAPERRTP